MYFQGLEMASRFKVCAALAANNSSVPNTYIRQLTPITPAPGDLMPLFWIPWSPAHTSHRNTHIQIHFTNILNVLFKNIPCKIHGKCKEKIIATNIKQYFYKMRNESNDTNRKIIKLQEKTARGEETKDILENR